MASQPFNPAETVPQDTDVVANFPSAERTFRDVMESWLLVEHGRTGHHALPKLTTSERDAITTWEAGSVIFNETTGVFQILDSADPDVWTSPTTGILDAPTGTRMLFQQTSAPTGWTKITDAAYNNVAIRLVTGTVSSGGDIDFTSAFSATLASEGHALTVNEIPLHGHPARFTPGGGSKTNDTGGIAMENSNVGVNHAAFTGALSDTPGRQIGCTGGDEEHTHTIDIAVKYRDFILAEKA
jgi:hypothetical protein